MSTHNLCFSQRNKCDTNLDTLSKFRFTFKVHYKDQQTTWRKNLHIPKSMNFTFCVNHLHAMEMIHAQCEVP